MKILARYALPDEPCWGLYEGPRQVPWGKGTAERWIQAVYVIRDDAIAEYAEDLGPAENYERIQPVMIPSFGENSVAQLREFAEKNRHDDYWARRADEMLASSTLVKDHLRQLEEDRLTVQNRSAFGPGRSVQRNGYPRKAARERFYGSR